METEERWDCERLMTDETVLTLQRRRTPNLVW